MKSRASELAVGIFVILTGIALFFLAMKVSGLVGTNLRDSYNMTASFDNVNGLKPRAKVTMSGVTIGRVTDITLDPVSRLATVYFELDGKLTSFNKEQLKKVKANALEELRYSTEYSEAAPAKQKEMEKQLADNMNSITSIDEDAYIMVATNGLLGEKYLKVVPGGGLNYVKTCGHVWRCLMKSRASELAVGIFVILTGIALFFLAMKVSGLVGTNLRDSYNMTASFDNVNGLKPRAKVTMSGVTIGRVTDITLDPVSRLATVYFELDGKLTSFNKEQLKKVKANALEELRYSTEYSEAAPAKQKEMEKQLADNMNSITSIDEDAYIMVATNGLLGEKYLKVVPGGGLNYVKRGESIANTQGTMDLEDLISKFITGGAGKSSAKAAEEKTSTESTEDAQTSFVE
jgi:phospholipid/cholesterol/gamma-HCH transport system substrate-binding protein